MASKKESGRQTVFITQCRARLKSLWAATQSAPPNEEWQGIPESIRVAIRAIVNSRTKTYRYVLPTHLLAKAVDPSLDCSSVQATSGRRGAFDARSLCHEVIVEFDSENSNVLGGSKEPYINNPLRIPALTRQYRHAQKDKVTYDLILKILGYAQSHREAAGDLLRCALAAIQDRLSQASITYPVPNRTSLEQTTRVVEAFLSTKSGGLRLQAIATALFRSIGHRFGLFATVHVKSVNAADAATGNAADLECRDSKGNVAIAVEVKDRSLTLRHAESVIPSARDKGIREVLFLVQGGVETSDKDSLAILFAQQFGTGQNLYVSEFRSFLETCLVLFGEGGRRVFMQEVGISLDEDKADITHRKAWALLLQGL